MKDLVYDPLRRKYVALTPEERIRQSLIVWLNKERGYPLQLMASEYSIGYNNRKFRCDIVCFNKRLEPLLIVECKSPEIKLGNAVLEQISRYNLQMRVPYLVITNGTNTYVCRYNAEEGEGKYEFITDIPDYNSIKQN